MQQRQGYCLPRHAFSRFASHDLVSKMMLSYQVGLICAKLDCTTHSKRIRMLIDDVI